MSLCNKIDRQELSQELLNWWILCKRLFPWRETRDPYKILVSEVLLHRTRAEQVVSTYDQFVRKFPNVYALSASSLKEITQILRPLGLNWRIKYLHKMAKIIVENYEGKIPSNKKELESLPGVGDYISSAVRCFAFCYPETLLDTNTVRILGRIFGRKITDASRRKKAFRDLARLIFDSDRPREFNFGLIDLGALICKSKEPLCTICPLIQMCQMGLKRSRQAI